MKMRKMMMILIMMAMMAFIAASMTGVFGATMKIYPDDDAFVRSAYTSTRYGTGDWENRLRVGYETLIFGKDRSYLKFDLSSVSGTINSTILSVSRAYHHDNPTINLYLVKDNNWNEETITWGDKPDYTTLIDSATIVGNPERIEFDVSSVMNNGNVLSFVLIEEGENAFVDIYSKEIDFGTEGSGEEYWPYLEIDYGGEETCPSEDYSNVCCTLTSLEMMNFINKFNKFETSYTPIEMMNFINKFNKFEALC